MRATTVIFEEDFSFDEPTVANIILPNKPHSTCLQVEEIGSFRFETDAAQSASATKLHNVSHESESHQSAIIDEIDSDTDHGGGGCYAYKTASTTRNVSIMSVSEDEASQCGDLGYTREISIEETQRNVMLDDGCAQVKVMRIVLEEQSVELGELGEIQERTIDGAHKIVSEGIEQHVRKAQLADIIDMERQQSIEAYRALETVDKNAEGKKITSMSIHHQIEIMADNVEVEKLMSDRNNKINQKAVQYNCENIAMGTINDDRQSLTEHQVESKLSALMMLSKEHATHSNGIESPEQYKEDLTNGQVGRKAKVLESGEDDEIEALFRRSEQQRSVLNEILEGKQQQAISVKEEHFASDLISKRKATSGKGNNVEISLLRLFIFFNAIKVYREFNCWPFFFFFNTKHVLRNYKLISYIHFDRAPFYINVRRQ